MRENIKAGGCAPALSVMQTLAQSTAIIRKDIWSALNSDSLQILHQVVLLIAAEIQFELRVVVVHYVGQRGETAVVVEAAFLVRPQARERRSAVLVGRRTVGLERVDADFVGRMQVLPRFCEERRDVASCALRRAIEDGAASFEGSFVVRSGGCLGGR